MIVDDYQPIDACRAAVDDYRRVHSISDELQTVDWSAVFWKKSDN